MNRVVFLFLSILLIVFPLTIENLENENVNYLELVKNITNELIHTVVKAQVKDPAEINFTNDQITLLKIKLDELEVMDTKIIECIKIFQTRCFARKIRYNCKVYF